MRRSRKNLKTAQSAVFVPVISGGILSEEVRAVLRNCGARVGDQRGCAEEYGRKQQIRRESSLEERNSLRVAVSQSGPGPGIPQPVGPYGEVADQEKRNGRTQRGAANVERLYTVLQQISDEAGADIPRPDNQLVSQQRHTVHDAGQI